MASHCCDYACGASWIEHRGTVEGFGRVFLLRRRALACLDLIFTAAACGELDQVIRLSPELKGELWCLVAIDLLIAVDFRAEPVDFIVATDASSRRRCSSSQSAKGPGWRVREVFAD